MTLQPSNPARSLSNIAVPLYGCLAVGVVGVEVQGSGRTTCRQRSLTELEDSSPDISQGRRCCTAEERDRQRSGCL